MKEMDVSAKIGKDGTPITIKFNLGETLAELVEQYTENVIYQHARSSIVVALQGYMRSKIDPERDGGPMTQEELQSDISGDGSEDKPGWRPGIRQPGKSAAERVKEQFSKMDPELRRALLAELAGGGVAQEEDTSGGEEQQAETVQTEQHQGRGHRRR